MTDTLITKEVEAGRLSSALGDSKAEIAKQRTRVYQAAVAADGGATANVAEEELCPVTYTGKAKAVTFRASDNINSGNGTNYAVVTVAYRDSVGGSAVNLGTINFGAVNAAAWTPLSMNVNAAVAAVAAGGCLTLRHDKTGSLELPAYTLEAQVEDE